MTTWQQVKWQEKALCSKEVSACPVDVMILCSSCRFTEGKIRNEFTVSLDKHLFGKCWGPNKGDKEVGGPVRKFVHFFHWSILSSSYWNPLACKNAVPTIMKQGWQQLSGDIERENPFTQWQSGSIDVRDFKKKNRWEAGGSQNGKPLESEQQYASLPSLGTNTQTPLHIHWICTQAFMHAYICPLHRAICLKFLSLISKICCIKSHTHHTICHRAAIKQC